MSDVSVGFDTTNKQLISMGPLKSSSSSFSSSSSLSSPSPPSSPPPSPGSDKTIGGDMGNLGRDEKSIEEGEENVKKSKAKKKKRGAQARANHEARKKEKRGSSGDYSSQSLASSQRIPPIISGTGSYSATSRQIVQDIFSIYGLAKPANKPFELNPAAPSWGNQQQLNYNNNNISVRGSLVGDRWGLPRGGFHSFQQNERGNRALSETAGLNPGSRMSRHEDIIMGNSTDGYNNGGGYEEYHDENLYNPARYTQTYLPRQLELTSPISDATSYPLTDPDIDSDLTKVINPVDRETAATIELSKIQHLLSKIQIEDPHKEEQLVAPVEGESVNPDKYTTSEDVKLAECNAEKALRLEEGALPEVIETIENNNLEVGKLNECNTAEEVIKQADPELNEPSNPVEWVIIGIIQPAEGVLLETLGQSDCKYVEEPTQPEANGPPTCKMVEYIVKKVENNAAEVAEFNECKITKELVEQGGHDNSEATNPTPFNTEVDTTPVQLEQDQAIKQPVTMNSTEAKIKSFNESHLKMELGAGHTPLGNDDTTIYASEKMLEKLRARIIQEYKDRIKDCEAELQEKDAALRDQKLISQKKQECLENYINITEGLTAEISGLNQALDQEKNKAEQAIKKEHETAQELAMTQEALREMSLLVDVERKKSEDAARRQYDAANELDMITSSYDCLQTRLEQEEANTRAATRKEHESARQLKMTVESFKNTAARLEKEEAKTKRLGKKESETAKQLRVITESFKNLQSQATEDKRRVEQAIKKESDTAKQLTAMTESLKEMRAHSDKDKKKIEKATKKEADAIKRLETATETLKEMQVTVEKERMKARYAAEKESDAAKHLEIMEESLKEVRASAEEEKKKAKSEITRMKKMSKTAEKLATEKVSNLTNELSALQESFKALQASIDEEENRTKMAVQKEADVSKKLEVMKQSLQRYIASITALENEKTEMKGIIGEIAQQNSFLRAKEEADNELLKSSYKIVRNIKERFKLFLPRPESITGFVKMPVSIVLMVNSNIKQLKKLMQTNESIEYEQALARKEKSDAIETILKMDAEKMAKDLALWGAKCKQLEANAAAPEKHNMTKPPLPTMYKTISNPPPALKTDTMKKDSDPKNVQTTKAKRGGGARGGGKTKGRGKRIAIADVFDFTNGIPEDVNLEDGMRTLLGRVSPKFGECNNPQPK